MIPAWDCGWTTRRVWRIWRCRLLGPSFCLFSSGRVTMFGMWAGYIPTCVLCIGLTLYLTYRFHAWQSSLLFTAVFVLHLLFLWSSFLSWVLFLGDLVLVGWLVMNAYRDADTLDRLVSVVVYAV